MCARASRGKVIVHGGKREYTLHKTRSPSPLLAPLYPHNTHAVVVSPIPFPYVTPILHQGYQHGCWLLFLRLLILPAPTLRRRSCTVRLRNGRSWNASTPRLESVHLPRLVKSSRRTRRIYERGEAHRGSEGREGERERDTFTLGGCTGCYRE